MKANKLERIRNMRVGKIFPGVALDVPMRAAKNSEILFHPKTKKKSFLAKAFSKMLVFKIQRGQGPCHIPTPMIRNG